MAPAPKIITVHIIVYAIFRAFRHIISCFAPDLTLSGSVVSRLLFIRIMTFNMKKHTLLLCCAWVFALSGYFGTPLYGQSGNPGINIQGILRDATGKTVDDGQYSVSFRLYTVRTGGMHVWQETADVDVTGGIFNHNLGSVTPLNAGDFSTTLYLGVKTNNFELTPRTELTYAPYTFAVSRALRVGCTGAVGDIKYSILNPTEFATVNGDCWVPMNGGPLSPDSKLGQILGTPNLPDGGGVAIRSQEFSGGQDNDPGRTPATPVATFQDAMSKSHGHTTSTDGLHTHRYMLYYHSNGYVPWSIAGVERWFPTGNDQERYALDNRIVSNGDHGHFVYENPGGTDVVRQKNLNFWVYIRIN